MGHRGSALGLQSVCGPDKQIKVIRTAKKEESFHRENSYRFDLGPAMVISIVTCVATK